MANNYNYDFWIYRTSWRFEIKTWRRPPPLLCAPTYLFIYIYTYCFWTCLLSNLSIHAPMYLTMHLHIYNICTYSRNMCISKYLHHKPTYIYLSIYLALCLSIYRWEIAVNQMFGASTLGVYKPTKTNSCWSMLTISMHYQHVLVLNLHPLMKHEFLPINLTGCWCT